MKSTITAFEEFVRSNCALYPVMGTDYNLSDFFHVDLSVHNSKLPNVSSPHLMNSFLNEERKRTNKPLPIGGYLEKRNLYSSSLFKSNGPIRDVHLGVDVWTNPGTPIYAPLDSVVYSTYYNDGLLDYGYTLILMHDIGETRFYTLYGHLGKSIMSLHNAGDQVSASSIIGHLGEEYENGGWCPHLHLQIIRDMQGNTKDYPGVCSEVDKLQFEKNCPDPTFLILV